MQQEYFEELLEMLSREEEICEACPDRCIIGACESCGRSDNIRELELLIAAE